MKKLSYLIVLALILGLVLTGCSLLSNVGQVPATGQKGMPLSTANLVALWHFDENSGTTAYDSTANSNDGTVSGAIWVDGQLGKALSFDGGSDYVDFGSGVTSLITGDYTVEAWIKPASLASGRHAAVSFSYMELGYDAGKVYFWQAYDNSWGKGYEYMSPTVLLDVTEFSHIVGVFHEDAGVDLYVDGNLIGSDTTRLGTSVNIFGNTYAGVWYTATGGWFDGTIDEVRIWDGALTADQIFYSYNDKTLHVDDDWVQWPGAYKTINEALAVAVDDDTIIVEAGTYNERVIINKPLTLQGENRDTTIIDGTGMTAEDIPVYGNNGILINPGSAYHMQDVGITISGFTVQNFAVIGAGGGAGIYADPTYQYSNITISDVIAKNNGLTGIYAANIVDSQFSNVVVDNNDQIGNGQGYGIHISVFSSSNTFTNIVAKNHDSTGIMVMQANSNTFDNIISSNNKYGIYYLLGSSGNIVTCSTISDNINNGIKLNAYGTACANNEIHFSNIVDNINGGVDAVNIGTGVTFDALYNWWGHATGPFHASTNPGGQGDAVSDNVDYDPWSFTPDPCEAKTLGFWKNHPDSVWAIFNAYVHPQLGGYLVSNESTALEILKKAKAKNANEMLAAQLLAAELNKLHLVHIGFDALCFDEPIDEADEFLTNQGYVYPNPPTPDKADKKEAIVLKNALDVVNNEGCGECVCEWD